MLRKSSILIFLLTLSFMSSVNAKTIVWVAENLDGDRSGKASDDWQVWIDKFTAEGYTVDAVVGKWDVLDANKVKALNAADLVIYSRATNSGTNCTDDAEIAMWNSVTTPIICSSPYIVRCGPTAKRWGWINYDEASLPNNNGDQGSPMMQVTQATHPIFYGITLDTSSQVSVADPLAYSGHCSFPPTNNVGNGVLIAKTVPTTLVQDYLWIVEWQPGVKFYSGATYSPAGRRMYFSAGAHELPQGTYPESGYNFTEQGWKLYMNAVRYMLGDLGKASSPQPGNGDIEITPNAILSWYPGNNANTHNLYFGTDFNDVNEADISNDHGVTVIPGLARDVNYYDPAIEYGKTYYWRVDEVGSASNPGTIKGYVWSFTMEPAALKLPKEAIIHVTTKSNNTGSDPNNTINENGLDPNTDLHTTGGCWWSGVTDANHPAWIRYDFDRLYKIHEMLVWNYNSVSTNSKYGFNNVLIEYSTDNGISWSDLNTVTQFAQGTGKAKYASNTTVPFNDIVISSVRITALSTWELTKYTKAGLAEIRFTYVPTRATTPSPETDANNISLDTILSWRSGREAVKHDVYISTDSQAVSNSSVTPHTVTVNNYAPLLDFGRTYYWSVTEVNDFEASSRWASDMWNFTTVEYSIVDDFEDYNGNSGYEIYMTWDDGLASYTNGSQIGYNDSPYIETTIIQHGKQSAPISYDNSGEVEPSAAYSEVTRIFAAPLNLTVNGADTLKLYTRGRAVTFGELPGGVIAMSAEGTDIGGTSDQFRFVYKTLSGNGYIIARVDGIQNTATNAEAGVMIRNTIDANSAHAMSFLRPNGTVSLQYREAMGGNTTVKDLTGLGRPYWVRVTRTGNTLKADRSKDGVEWYSFETDANTPSTFTVTNMNNSVLIGLAVDSRVADTLASAIFSGVSFSSNVTGDWTVAEIGDESQADGENTLDALYITLEDSAGAKAKIYSPLAVAGFAEWMEWLVPYSQITNVDMSKLAKFTIGIGDAAATSKGKGMFYIDNICYGHPADE